MSQDQKIKILLVDDDDQTRSMYANMFEENGFNVIEAKDGIEALDMATSEEGIDVIFTGIIMPRMDGFQLMEALRGHTQTASIPVIVNSHMGREDDRKKSLELGAKDFIVRGLITPAEAVRRIFYSLHRGKYKIKVDPFEYDAEKLIEDFKLPDKLKCYNCGTNLVLLLELESGTTFKANISCPNCDKRY